MQEVVPTCVLLCCEAKSRGVDMKVVDWRVASPTFMQETVVHIPSHTVINGYLLINLNTP